MTSDNQYHCLDAYFYLWLKYFGLDCDTVICGFSPLQNSYPARFYSIGQFEDYPPHRWSDALIKVLDEVAEDVFILMLGDYWLTRPVDVTAVKMMYDYMRQFEYVAKFDLTTDRLFADGGGKYLFGYNTYDTLGYLDLIKSVPGSPYHLSLWGGIWRRDLLRQVLVHGETAQQIELNGTHRLSQYGDEMLVLGTRQGPMKHANVIQGGKLNMDAMVGLPALTAKDTEELKEQGYL
jgi:hypothetical protein